eukprot:jgi/Bigna1/67684/fgenesh1_pg.4_\
MADAKKRGKRMMKGRKRQREDRKSPVGAKERGETRRLSNSKALSPNSRTTSAKFSKGKLKALKFAAERKKLPIYEGRQVRDASNVMKTSFPCCDTDTIFLFGFIPYSPDALVQAVRDNKCLVIVGETGSGKTTQLPQYLYETGFCKGSGSTIAVTQPRRVAAVTVAQRVADEMGSKLGEQVGYSVRFDDKTSRQTKIKYLTDGMLLREASIDPLLKRYSLVDIQKRRKKEAPLKIIAMSATLQAEKFAGYFGGAPILYVKGRQFPVDIMYTLEPQQDYIDTAVTTDFVGKPTWAGRVVVICPLYAALPAHQQLEAFKAADRGCRKVVLATNIAETSVTIHGIVYVIDAGVVKVRQNHPKTGIESLVVVPISKAEAWQRSGRAGRVQPGTCYRLFMEATFKDLRETRVPEVLRTSLASVVLQLKALRVDDVGNFDFMSKPPRAAIMRALEELVALGAINRKGKLSEPLGRKMAEMPLAPKFSRALLSSEKFDCVNEVLTIVSLLSSDAGGLFITPRTKRVEAAAARRQFAAPEGDLITYLNVRQQLRRLLSRMKVNISCCRSEEDRSDIIKALLCGFFLNTARKQSNGAYRAMQSGQEVRIHPSSILCSAKPESIMFTELIVTSQKYLREVSAIETRWLAEVVPNYFSKQLINN